MKLLDPILKEVLRLYNNSKQEGYIPYTPTPLKERYEYDEPAAATKIASALHEINESYLGNFYRLKTGETTSLQYGNAFDIADEINTMEIMVAEVPDRVFNANKFTHQPLQSPASTEDIKHRLNAIYQRLLALGRF